MLAFYVCTRAYNCRVHGVVQCITALPPKPCEISRPVFLYEYECMATDTRRTGKKQLSPSEVSAYPLLRCLKLLSEFKQLALCHLKHGSSVLLWIDKWQEQPLHLIYPHRASLLHHWIFPSVRSCSLKIFWITFTFLCHKQLMGIFFS